MLKWIRIEAGEYESEGGRFSVIKTWDRLYGDHWDLHDSSEPDYYKSIAHCDSLKHAKHVASVRVEREMGKYPIPEITKDML